MVFCVRPGGELVMLVPGGTSGGRVGPLRVFVFVFFDFESHVSRV